MRRVKVIYKDHKYGPGLGLYSPSKTERRAKAKLNMAGRKHMHDITMRFENGHMAPDDPLRDVLGGSSSTCIAGPHACGEQDLSPPQAFRDVCLVTSLRALGVPVPYTASSLP